MVAGTVTVEAGISHGIHVQRVQFLANGVAIGEAQAPPYTVAWDTMTVPNTPVGLQARVMDLAGHSATSDPVTVKVSNPNRYPLMSPIGDRHVKEGERLTLSLRAHDPDGSRDPLAFTIAHHPPWLLCDHAGWICEGTPDPGDIPPDGADRDYPDVRVEVCDPERLCDRDTFTITVTARRDRGGPAIEPLGEQRAQEGQPFSWTVKPDDPEGRTTTCRALRLPLWATLRIELDRCRDVHAQGHAGPRGREPRAAQRQRRGRRGTLRRQAGLRDQAGDGDGLRGGERAARGGRDPCADGG